MYCCPQCKQLGSAGLAASLTLLTDEKGDTLGSKSHMVPRRNEIRSAAKPKQETFLPALRVILKYCCVKISGI